jgi:hypothetical protein
VVPLRHDNIIIDMYPSRIISVLSIIYHIIIIVIRPRCDFGINNSRRAPYIICIMLSIINIYIYILYYNNVRSKHVLIRLE